MAEPAGECIWTVCIPLRDWEPAGECIWTVCILLRPIRSPIDVVEFLLACLPADICCNRCLVPTPIPQEDTSWIFVRSCGPENPQPSTSWQFVHSCGFVDRSFSAAAYILSICTLLRTKEPATAYILAICMLLRLLAGCRLRNESARLARLVAAGKRRGRHVRVVVAGQMKAHGFSRLRVLCARGWRGEAVRALCAWRLLRGGEWVSLGLCRALCTCGCCGVGCRRRLGCAGR